MHITGPLNAEAWERALNAIVQRHEALRTTFVAGEGEPVQVISESLQLHLPLVSLEALPPDEREAQLRALVLAESQQPFDLAHGPLIRGVLYRLGADEHVLFLSMHHIVSDGWSMGILIRELALLCQEFSGGEAARLTPLPIQYADYAAWQRAWFQSEEAARQLDYWRRQLAGAPTLLELPTDKPRPPVQSYRGATYNFRLPAELSQALAGLSQGEQATLFMTLLAAFQTLLYRYSGQEDILVGSPIANRTRAELEGLIGFFVNTLVLRADLSGNPSFRQLLHRVRQTTLDAYAHQDTPFERVVDELQPQRSTSHTPLFQVMFILQNTPMPAITTETVRIRPLELDGGAAKFDLTLAFEETPEGLRGSLEYASDLFEEATIRRMAMHYEMLLRAIVRSPDTGIADLELMDSTELQRVVREWNDTAVDYPEPGWIHQCFEAQAERTPDALAVVFEDQFLTYAQLNARANQLAHYLRTLGVGPETRVGVCLERSLELVVALLGILKAGGAYVPLDPSYPAERLAFMLHDAQVPVLLSHSTLGERLPAFAGHLLCLDRDWPAIAACSSANPDVRLDGDNLAYIIYTSGSTGTPKGAMNSHAAIRNRLLWMQQAYQLTPSDRVLQKTPFSFDVSVWEFFWPLMVGARLVVARPDGHRDSAYLIELIAREQVTTLHFVPSMLQLFLADPAVERCSSLRLMICSGEALSAALSQRVGERLPQVALHNLYGPTEAAVDVTAWPCASDGRSVPIGRPIANTQIYLLDRRLRPVPIGVPGELYIGGVQLARGYWNRPELTAERFIPDPFSAQAGARLYKTGDLARYLADGAIEYLGRLDHQIKLRGFRIELGEIEAALLRHPDIREAVVVAHQEHDGDARLIAYIVGEQGQMPAQHELMAFLKQTLPEYMVPAVFVPLEALPLSPNGKLDRRALPAPTLARPDLARPYVAPRSGMEQTLAAIWQELLGIEQVGIDDNFFDLGGHSLLLAQARNRLQTALGRPIAMIELFEYPTIRTLVQHLTQEDEEDAVLAQSDDRSEQRKASLQRRREQRRSRQLVDAGEDDDEPGYD
ncbi:MAG: hypothetical protein KatS3mg057_2230 [Herpetosiphonaceae bacterium]|nr:MAG: hypothetical protein KatS3mg057_2230 [Herpetosiphonaceae bacterium]